MGSKGARTPKTGFLLRAGAVGSLLSFGGCAAGAQTWILGLEGCASFILLHNFDQKHGSHSSWSSSACTQPSAAGKGGVSVLARMRS